MKKYWQGALTGVVTGVVTGLAVGYLTAPQSGKKTLKKLGNLFDKTTGNVTSKAKQQWDKSLAMGVDAVDEVMAKSDKLAQKAKNKVADYQDDAKDGLQEADAKNTYNHKVDDAADAAKSAVNKAEDSLKAS